MPLVHEDSVGSSAVQLNTAYVTHNRHFVEYSAKETTSKSIYVINSNTLLEDGRQRHHICI